MAPLSASALVPRARAAARRVAPLLALLLVAAGPAAAQVRPQLPQTPQRPDLPRRDLPQAPAGDLVITAVTVQDVTIPTPATTARVTVQNKGPAAAVFPAGSVLARGDAVASGGVAFQAMTSPSEYTIAAGESKTLTLSVGDPCAAGKAGAVVFRVDPDNKVHEGNEGNNTSTVSAGSFVAADLVALGMGLRSTGPSYGADKNTSIPAGYPADLELTLRNGGSGPALVCPGAAVFRETASPVSSKYGLRTVKHDGSAARLLQPGTVTIWKLANAYAAGDLPPGGYPWNVLVNPDGRIPETSASNNAANGGVAIR